MFHYTEPIIRRKVGGLVTLSVASYKSFIWNNIQINMVYYSLLKGFNTFLELNTKIKIFFFKTLSKYILDCPNRLRPFLSDTKDITENNPAFFLQSSLNLTLI